MKVTKKQQLVLWLKDNPGLHWTQELWMKHDVSKSTVLSALRELEKEGLAQRRLGGRNAFWVVKRDSAKRRQQ